MTTSLAPLHAVRTGPRGGAPVVLIHAVGLDLTYWSHQIEALCDRHDVVALDLPGHGRSAGRPEDWTLDQAAEALLRVVLSTGYGSAHLVGLSVGGMIAQAMTFKHPQMVRSLTLIDTAASFEPQARAAMLARAALARAHGMAAVVPSTIERWFTPAMVARRPDLVDRVTKTLWSADPLIHAAMWDMIAELDVVSQLPGIACPTLVLVGEHDPSSPPSAARLLQRHIVDARLHVVADASHLSPLEKPAAINLHLLEFLVR